MKFHNMNLQKIHFDNVVSGQKIYECRLYDEKRKSLGLLDVITFNCDDKSHKVIITELSFHRTFELALVDKGMTNVLPDSGTINDGIQLYHNIKGYESGEERYGVLCIKFLSYKN